MERSVALSDTDVASGCECACEPTALSGLSCCHAGCRQRLLLWAKSGLYWRSRLLSLGPLLLPGLALAFHDGSVHIVHRLSLQMMAVFYGSSSQRPVDEQSIKRQRTAGPLVHFKAMQLSWTSLALAGIDSHGKVLCSHTKWGELVSSRRSPSHGSLRKTPGMFLAAV